MTTPTNPNEPKKKKRNAVAGESLGSGVQSRVGGTDGQEPLRSSNELNIPKVTPPPITTANSGVNKASNVMQNAGEQHYKDSIYKNLEALYNQDNAFNTDPSSVNPTKTVVKTKKTANYTPPEYTPNVYNQEEANKRAESWLEKMRSDAEVKENEYKDKAEKASKYSKMAAWGNLFTALGQLAGGAKQTYVKPDSKYLTEAMAKSDKAREVYDAIRESNRQNLEKAKQSFLEADRNMHIANEENRRKFQETLVKEGYKNAAKNTTETTEENDLYKEDDLAVDQKNANANWTRAQKYNSGRQQKEETPFFTPEYDGVTYEADEKTAGKFADIIEEILEANPDTDFMEGDKSFKEIIDDNLKNDIKFDRFARRFLKKYGTDPRVKEFIEKLEKQTKNGK